jgi:membrane-associated phospholipid phosphatase
MPTRLRRMVPCILLLALFAGPPAQAGDAIETAGDALLIALPVAAAGTALYHRDGTGALQLAESELLSSAVTLTLKYTVDATRPNGDKHSFPSAHTSISFTAAEFMRKRYGWEFGIPAYALASFVAYSRVEADQHYARDVIAGAAIGIAAGYIFTRPYPGMTLQPDVGAGYYGVRLSRSWE